MNRVPDGWRKYAISELALIKRGASPRPIDDTSWFAEEGPGWVRIVDVTKSDKYLRKTKQCLSEEGVKKSVFVPSDTLIMSICATVGVPIITKIDVCVHDGFVVFDKINQKFVDLLFLYYGVSHVVPSMLNKSQHGTQKNINTDIVKETTINLPTLPEQKKIAAILSSVDEAIAATQAVIDQTRKVKQGLLQDLPTRGIGHTRFKQTEIGVIPEAWEVKKLGTLLKTVERPVAMADDEEYQLVTVKRRQEGIVPRGVLRGRDICVKSQFMLETGDFVISKRQIVHGACEVVPEKLHGSIVSNEYSVLHPVEELDTDYIRWLTRTPLMMRYFMVSSIGVHIEKMLFKLKDWFRLPIALPPIEEQRAISAALNSIETSLEGYRVSMEEMFQVKRGLMQDLLSGSVRVTTP